ncbi:hypothetical protein AAG906_000536 [Vitis piasezkii]
MRGSACVEVMTTLHGSAPSLRRRAEGCIPSEGMIASARDLLKSTHIHLEQEEYLQIGFYSRSGIQLSRLIDSTTAMASIQRLWLASSEIDVDDSHPPPPPLPVPSHRASPYVLHGTRDRSTRSHPGPRDDTHARMDRIERAHGLDEPQMITLFPLSLSGAAQRWFASLESSRRRTWDDLAQEFLRQFSFNTVVDVSRRELEALRQRTEESVSSFISRWRGKIAEIVDRPSERDQIQMVLRSLQPRIARHVVGVPFADFGSLVMALYDVEDGISRGLWADSSPSDVKGKKPFVGPRSTDVSAISSSSQRLPRRHQPIPQFSEPHSSHASHRFRPRASCPTFDQTYRARPLALPYYATQGIARPLFRYRPSGSHATAFTPRPTPSYPRPRAQQTSAPFALRTQRQFSQIGMPLSQALRKLIEAGLLTALTPRPLPQPIPAQFRMDLHCAYHQGPGHETDRCTALRHAIQDLIDQGLVHLGQPSVTTNPLPTHTTHAVPPPADGIHFLDFDEIDDHVHMLSWDDPDPEPIMPAGIYETSGVTLEPQMPAPFRLVPEAASVQAATSEPLIFTHYSVQRRTFDPGC